MRIYKFIKNLGYPIIKCPRSEKYYNAEYDERYIPDFKIKIGSTEYICEYFGLYSKKHVAYSTEKYTLRADRKIEYFSKNFNFISFFPADFERGLKGIEQKLEERR